jgi:hypothetical protein
LTLWDCFAEEKKSPLNFLTHPYVFLMLLNTLIRLGKIRFDTDEKLNIDGLNVVFTGYTRKEKDDVGFFSDSTYFVLTSSTLGIICAKDADAAFGLSFINLRSSSWLLSLLTRGNR